MKNPGLIAMGALLLLMLGACGGYDRGPRIEDDRGRWSAWRPDPGAELGSRCGGSVGTALCGEAMFPSTRGNGPDDRGYRGRR